MRDPGNEVEAYKSIESVAYCLSNWNTLFLFTLRYSRPIHKGVCMIYALGCVLRKTMERTNLIVSCLLVITNS